MINSSTWEDSIILPLLASGDKEKIIAACNLLIEDDSGVIDEVKVKLATLLLNQYKKNNIQWIDVKDRLPFDDCSEECLYDNFMVIIEPDDSDDDIIMTIYQYNRDDGWCYVDGTSITCDDNVTHWAELPKT